MSGTLNETWIILNESSPWLLFGFTIAALVKAFMPDEFIARHLGKSGVRSVVKAALIGIPLPLCSCGVIPAAISVRRQGASRGATTAFLVSTPETSEDSIAITWALMDPVMTVFRPFAAMVMAIVAGIIEDFVHEKPIEMPVAESSPATPEACGCGGCCAAEMPLMAPESKWKKIVESFKYSFGDLLSDIGLWLLLGTLIAGVIGFVVPDSVFQSDILRGPMGMFVMLIMSGPLYVCATSSTPIAAIMMAKGLSPGAALVFLLAGPATNAATVMVVGKFMGRRSLVAYLVSIMGVSLAMGFALNGIYVAFKLKLIPGVVSQVQEGSMWFASACSILLLVLIVRGVIMSRVKRGS